MPDVSITTAVWCREDPGAGAYAFRCEQAGRKPVQAAFGRRLTTANRMQMMALLGAAMNIEKANPGREGLEIRLRSTGAHLVNGIRLGQEKSPPGDENGDLWARIAGVSDRHSLTAERVQAGSTIELQVLQKLAEEAALREGLPPDTGYEAMTRGQPGGRSGGEERK